MTTVEYEYLYIPLSNNYTQHKDRNTTIEHTDRKLLKICHNLIYILTVYYPRSPTTQGINDCLLSTVINQRAWNNSLLTTVTNNIVYTAY